MHTSTSDSSSPAPHPPPPRLNVLVVEDERIVARDLEYSLLEMGHDVLASVDTCAGALEAARRRTPDVVLMDVRIKGDIDGVTTAEMIVREFDVPVIFLTAYSDDALLERAAATLPYGYIVKPFTQRDIRGAIEVACFKHRADQHVKRERLWLSTTLRSIGDAVVACGPDGAIEFMNPVAEGLTGWQESEAIGQPAEAVLELRLGEGVGSEHPIRKAMHTKTQQSLAATWLAERGGERCHLIDDSVAPIVHEDALLGAVVVFRDITERQRRAEQQGVVDRLVALGTVAAAVGHEIGTPLAFNISNISLALDEVKSWRKRGQIAAAPDVEMVENALEDAHAGATAIMRIAADLRPFSSRAAPGRSFGLRQCLEWSLKLTRSRLEEVARVVTRFGEVPEITGDEFRLSQVFVNLLVNASEAFTERSPDNEVRIELGLDGPEAVVVDIHDTGPGVPARAVDRIFDRFFSTKASGSGSGLGLAICKEIVEDMGGELSLLTHAPGATCFRVRMPVGRGPKTATPGSTSELEESASTRSRVLVVGDDPLVCRSLRRRLASQYETFAAESLDRMEAHLTGERRCQVVLADLQAFGGGMLERLREIVTSTPSGPIGLVLMTEEASAHVKQVASGLGAQLLPVPFSMRQLDAAVGRAVLDVLRRERV